MTDKPRYVFAKLDGTGWYASNVTSIPAPDPADWQKVVEAYKHGERVPPGRTEHAGYLREGRMMDEEHQVNLTAWRNKLTSPQWKDHRAFAITREELAGLLGFADELVKVGTWCDDCEAGGIDGFDSGEFPVCPLTGKPHTEPIYRLVPPGGPPMSDRYVFAKVDPDAGPKALHLTKPTAVPAPDPADWQAIVDVVKRGDEMGAPRIALRLAVGDIALAAVRNMEARS